MEIQGTLKQLNPVIERGEFKSRKVWIVTAENPEYPQTIELEVSGKSLDIFDNIAPGAPVTCHVNLRGREWTNPADNVTKVFNTLQCLKVAGVGSGQSSPAAAPQVAPELPVEDNSLPF